MEKWRTIKGFENYEVSNLGNVRRSKPGPHTKVGRLLKPYVVKGYVYVRLTPAGGKDRGMLIHLLVAKAFIPNPLSLPEVNHKGAKTDNRATELSWISIEDHGKDRAIREQLGDGVYYDKKSKKYMAHFSPETNHKVYLGSFNSYENAKKIRDKAMYKKEQ